jgi:hypothetical protein
MRFYHYTCDHGRKALGARGMLRPQPQPVLGGVRLVWLTDIAKPDREGLGLTSHLLDCDRLAYRYVVDAEPESWREWAWRNAVPWVARMRLEDAPNAAPSTWYVLESSVLGVLDRHYRPEAA